MPPTDGSDATIPDDDCARFAVYCPKGGIGKTTTAGHTGVALERAGLRTLLIDLAGTQGDLAKQFGRYDEVEYWIEAEDADDWPNISTAFKSEWSNIVSQYRNELNADVFENLLWDTGEGPDLIPAHPGLDGLESYLDNEYSDARRWTRLNAFIEDHVTPRYDAVLLDLPGDAKNVSYNGLFAARHVVTPVQAGSFEKTQAETLADVLTDIHEIHGTEIDFTMLIPNMIDQRTTLSGKYISAYTDRFGDIVAPKHIPDSQAIPNAQDDGRTLFAVSRPSDTAKRAIDAFETNAHELVRRYLARPTEATAR